MHRYHQRTIIFLCAFLSSCLGDCLVPGVINITIFSTVDSTSEKITVEGTITHDKDLFHLILGNETLPRLCQNQVVIHNELSIIQIVNTSLEEIEPGAFDIVPHLTLMKISENPISAIRKGVFNGVKTKELDLSSNRIASIDPEAFDNNTCLEILTLDNNALKEIGEWFRNSPNVYKLSIVFNEVSELPAAAFANMAKDRPVKLRLSSNRIYEVHPNALDGLSQVEMFRISGNRLTGLPDGLFKNRTIRKVQINANELRCLPDSLFTSGVEILEFPDNPAFDCECLKKVRVYVEANKVDIVYPAIICEDKTHEVNVVYNYNKTYEIPVFPYPINHDNLV